MRLARFAGVRLLRHALPVSLPILRKKRLFCSVLFHLQGGQAKNLAKSNESVRSSFLLFIGDPIPTENIKYPCVVKASKGEDSKSVRLVKDKQSLDAAIKHALTYSNQVIIERYRLSRLYNSKKAKR